MNVEPRLNLVEFIFEGKKILLTLHAAKELIDLLEMKVWMLEGCDGPVDLLLPFERLAVKYDS